MYINHIFHSSLWLFITVSSPIRPTSFSLSLLLIRPLILLLLPCANRSVTVCWAVSNRHTQLVLLCSQQLPTPSPAEAGLLIIIIFKSLKNFILFLKSYSILKLSVIILLKLHILFQPSSVAATEQPLCSEVTTIMSIPWWIWPLSLCSCDSLFTDVVHTTSPVYISGWWVGRCAHWSCFREQNSSLETFHLKCYIYISPPLLFPCLGNYIFVFIYSCYQVGKTFDSLSTFYFAFIN